MNNKVTVTGMTITTQVSDNILIAPADPSDASKNGNTETAYRNALHQVREALLEPSSTINGVNFYWTSTSNVQADGDAIDEVYTAYNEGTSQDHDDAGKTAYDAAFNTNYGITSPTATATGTAYGYLDYSFYLKATNTDTAAKKVIMDKCNLLYQGSATAIKAWRAAMFVQSATKETAQTTALASTDVKTILTPASAVNQTSDTYAVGSGSTAPEVKALAYGHTTTDNDITTYNVAAIVDDSIDGATTEYYKVTIRFWLEGEDKQCTNETFASLTKDWRLDLQFSMAASGGVTNIGSVATGTLTKSGNVATAALSVTGETAATYEFFKADDNSSLGTASATATYTNSGTAAINVYCLITTEKGNVYRTPTIELPNT